MAALFDHESFTNSNGEMEGTKFHNVMGAGSGGVTPNSSGPGKNVLYEALFIQVQNWVNAEKQKRKVKKIKRPANCQSYSPPPDCINTLSEQAVLYENEYITERRNSLDSCVSDESVALNELSEILDNSAASYKHCLSMTAHREVRQARSLRRNKSYFSMGSYPSQFSVPEEKFDTRALESVPSCNIFLDNSKTVAHWGGGFDDENLFFSSNHHDHDNVTLICDSENKPCKNLISKERQSWRDFKRDILNITHVLRLKRWRLIPMDRSSEIHVERLSGALTNSVYVVSASPGLVEYPSLSSGNTDNDPAWPGSGHDGNFVDGIASGHSTNKNRKTPAKLLLRIYGSQVSHLIDRKSELAILERLAERNIGPRLLGKFANGRLEEFFNGVALKPKDLRRPEYSRMIAKRMRELHDGVQLLNSERDSGPMVWRNWDKWVERCEMILSRVDGIVEKELSTRTAGGIANQLRKASPAQRWMYRGYPCGTPWKEFKQAVEKYRRWLEQECGGLEKISKEMVFAHNDTQYGNILRLLPPTESPLLRPGNVHKQLVVIDFEYANANVRGLEFANHFTEWCYNYHDPDTPYACNIEYYPTREQQREFIKAYLSHKPTYNLDSENSPVDECSLNGNYELSELIDKLERETRIWRAANSAMWVAWGVVQAQCLDTDKEVELVMDTVTCPCGNEAELNESHNLDKETSCLTDIKTSPSVDNQQQSGFDYVAYSQERAKFFWADIVDLGIIQLNDLDSVLRERVSLVQQKISTFTTAEAKSHILID